MMPKRIQLRRTKGWRKPEGAIVVSRPSKWGNPYSVSRLDSGWYDIVHGESFIRALFVSREPAVREAVRRFECALFEGSLEYDAFDVRRELRGKDLCCWCPEGHPCHADVLLEVANG